MTKYNLNAEIILLGAAIDREKALSHYIMHRTASMQEYLDAISDAFWQSAIRPVSEVLGAL